MSGSAKPIVVVGSVTMDMVTLTPVIPSIGQTVIGTGFTTTPGGKGANQAVAAALLGAQVAMVGCVGNDVYGPQLLKSLAGAGVHTGSIETTEGPSGLAPIFVDHMGQNAIVVVQGANGKVTPQIVDRHAATIKGAGIVLCQLELPLETTLHTIALCAEAGVPVMLDPAPAAALPDEVFAQIEWFTPNESEAELYVGTGLSVEAAAESLFARGVRGVVLKRGGEGSYIARTGGEGRWVAPFSVEVKDTVGAGDCFNGAFAVALMEGVDPWEAGRFASAAAAVSVSRSGAQAAMPTLGEVMALLS
ncbi:MAG: ribokinase [Acidobacteriota bacterium]|nr:ribokinase [Acidobacteriota bacterium]